MNYIHFQSPRTTNRLDNNLLDPAILLSSKKSFIIRNETGHDHHKVHLPDYLVYVTTGITIPDTTRTTRMLEPFCWLIGMNVCTRWWLRHCLKC